MSRTVSRTPWGLSRTLSRTAPMVFRTVPGHFGTMCRTKFSAQCSVHLELYIAGPKFDSPRGQGKLRAEVLPTIQPTFQHSFQLTFQPTSQGEVLGSVDDYALRFTRGLLKKALSRKGFQTLSQTRPEKMLCRDSKNRAEGTELVRGRRTVRGKCRVLVFSLMVWYYNRSRGLRSDDTKELGGTSCC
jgi:hypothetical protein